MTVTSPSQKNSSLEARCVLLIGQVAYLEITVHRWIATLHVQNSSNLHETFHLRQSSSTTGPFWRVHHLDPQGRFFTGKKAHQAFPTSKFHQRCSVQNCKEPSASGSTAASRLEVCHYMISPNVLIGTSRHKKSDCRSKA